MNFLEEFKKRGYFYQCTGAAELAEKMQKEGIFRIGGFRVEVGNVGKGK